MIVSNGISLDYSLACSVICIDSDYLIADAITHGLACTCMGAASQRAVYRWWGAHASCLLDQYRVIYKQFFPNNY